MGRNNDFNIREFQNGLEHGVFNMEKVMRVKSLLMLGIVCLTVTAAYCETADEKMTQCIQKADIKNLEEALKGGGNPNLADAQGNTVLIMASTFGQVDTVKVLLAHGADVNAQNQDGNTALMAACKNNRLEIVKLLLEKNANVNLKNQSGDTALTIAMGKGFKDVSKLLITAVPYIDVDAKMLTAAIKSNDENLYKLIKAKADSTGISDEKLNENARNKLDNIIIDKLELDNVLITQVVIKLNAVAKELDYEKKGVRIILPMPRKETSIPKITMSVDKVSIGEAIEQLCSVSGFKYKIDLGDVIIYKEFERKKEEKEFYEVAFKDRNLMPFKKDNKSGFVDINTGKVAIAPQFDKTYWFWDGACIVMVDKKWGAIDTKGNFILKPQFEQLSGIARKDGELVPAKMNNKWGFINKAGRFVIEPQFDAVERGFDTYNTLSSVKIGNKWGFIDKTGKFVIEPKFDELYGGFYRESVELVPAKTNSKWGLIDKNGKFVTEVKFDKIFGTFDNELDKIVPAKMNSKWGFIDKTGKFVIEPQFDDARPFDGGAASVTMGNKMGYIDVTGKFIIEPIFERSWGFYIDGFASACVGKKWGVIDMTGQFIIDPQFDDIDFGSFEDKKYFPKVKIGKNYYKINRLGKIVSPVYFTK